jgi:ABC-type Fe3+-hydroxamate transport system substrate-binding protein
LVKRVGWSSLPVARPIDIGRFHSLVVLRGSCLRPKRGSGRRPATGSDSIPDRDEPGQQREIERDSDRSVVRVLLCRGVLDAPAPRRVEVAAAVTGAQAAATDWAGVTHPPAGTGARIACLVPSLTELLFALDLGSRVVARTGFCVHPRAHVRGVPKVGGTKDVDLDALRATRPTHLVVNVDENRRETVDAACAFVPHVVVTHPLVPEDNRRLYALLGTIFGREGAAHALTRRFDAALAALERAVTPLPRETVLYLIWRSPWMTVARDTYVSATLARAGFDTLPAAAATRYPALDEADRAWRDAERLLLSTEPYAFRARDRDALARATGKRVDLIDGEWTSWYGPRAIDGLAALARFRTAAAGPARDAGGS